jgi:metallophosphoesterase (TIGR00282 family)|tara:strand:+ start:440375 stop:441190 length:816 start_codon:yes stop_codon:yes gene_type:complete
MRIVFLGDVFGKTGRQALSRELPQIRRQYKPDVIIVNGENAAHGMGITTNIAKEFFALGVDVITTGNHIWDQREIIPYLEKEDRVLRPINFPEGAPGNGVIDYRLENGQIVRVINVMARLFMDALDDPFAAMNEVLKDNPLRTKHAHAVVVDVHGEATSEKMVMGMMLDGRVSFVVGTHTHIPTADTRILEKGTAYQTDAGMCGDYNSVIGVTYETAAPRFIKKYANPRMAPKDGGVGTVCGTFVETDDKTGLAVKAEPIRLGPELMETRK